MKIITKGRILILLGLCLIASALYICVYNRNEDVEAGDAAYKQLDAVMIQIPDIAIGEEPVKLEGEMPAVSYDGKSFIGIVTIPSLGRALPVQSDWSTINARTSPCRYKGSAYDNDLIVCAHNYTEHFGPLNTLMSGDEVIFTDVNGNNFYYEVVSTETIDSYGIEEMEAGDWDLTLFTCTIGGASRVTVRCAATGEVTQDFGRIRSQIAHDIEANKHVRKTS